jgi:ketosteroid isomerase-like protein
MTSNTEIIRGLYEALAGGDIPSILGRLDPNISWTQAEGFPYAGTYTGPNAVLENVFMKLGSEWDGFSAVANEFVSEGDTVVSIGKYSGKYKATGKSFVAPFVHVWNMQNGKAVKFRQFTDTVIVQRALQHN